jgi:Skp family chaperone for outer membrane proteins
MRRPTRKVDFTEAKAKLQRKPERYLEAFADEAMTREELKAAMAKLDVERGKLEAQEAEQTRRKPLRDRGTRRAMLTQVKTLEKAWGRTTPAERREILGEMARAVRLERGKAPVVDWKSPEEMATVRE